MKEKSQDTINPLVQLAAVVVVNHARPTGGNQHPIPQYVRLVPMEAVDFYRSAK